MVLSMPTSSGESAKIERNSYVNHWNERCCQKYDNGTTALRGVSVTIEPGEFAYIVGPSGAGKSTFIRALYREVKIEKGSLTVAGFNLVKIKKKDVPLLRRSVGVVFQDYKLLPKKTVYENIAYAMEVIGESRRNIKKTCYGSFRLGWIEA